MTVLFSPIGAVVPHRPGLADGVCSALTESIRLGNFSSKLVFGERFYLHQERQQTENKKMSGNLSPTSNAAIWFSST